MVKRAGGSLLLSIKIDRGAQQRVSTQRCIALRDLILTGGFLPGERLPASRTLALVGLGPLKNIFLIIVN